MIFCAPVFLLRIFKTAIINIFHICNFYQYLNNAILRINVVSASGKYVETHLCMLQPDGSFRFSVCFLLLQHCAVLWLGLGIWLWLGKDNASP